MPVFQQINLGMGCNLDNFGHGHCSVLNEAFTLFLWRPIEVSWMMQTMMQLLVMQIVSSWRSKPSYILIININGWGGESIFQLSSYVLSNPSLICSAELLVRLLYNSERSGKPWQMLTL